MVPAVNHKPLHHAVRAQLAGIRRLHNLYRCFCDPACGSSEGIETAQLSLFDDAIDMIHELCRIDCALIHRQSGTVKMVVDITETHHVPNQLLGKFFTAAFSNKLTYDQGGYKQNALFSPEAIFVQVVNLPEETSEDKTGQLVRLKDYVNRILSKHKNNPVQSYHLIISRDGHSLEGLQTVLEDIN